MRLNEFNVWDVLCKKIWNTGGACLEGYRVVVKDYGSLIFNGGINDFKLISLLRIRSVLRVQWTHLLLTVCHSVRQQYGVWLSAEIQLVIDLVRTKESDWPQAHPVMLPFTGHKYPLLSVRATFYTCVWNSTALLSCWPDSSFTHNMSLCCFSSAF